MGMIQDVRAKKVCRMSRRLLKGCEEPSVNSVEALIFRDEDKPSGARIEHPTACRSRRNSARRIHKERHAKQAREAGKRLCRDWGREHARPQPNPYKAVVTADSNNRDLFGLDLSVRMGEIAFASYDPTWWKEFGWWGPHADAVDIWKYELEREVARAS